MGILGPIESSKNEEKKPRLLKTLKIGQTLTCEINLKIFHDTTNLKEEYLTTIMNKIQFNADKTVI